MGFRKQRWEFFADTPTGRFGFECDAKNIEDFIKKALYQIQHEPDRKKVFKVTMKLVEQE